MGSTPIMFCRHFQGRLNYCKVIHFLQWNSFFGALQFFRVFPGLKEFNAGFGFIAGPDLVHQEDPALPVNRGRHSRSPLAPRRSLSPRRGESPGRRLYSS